MVHGDLLREVAALCERLGIRYFVTGSSAISLHGNPRLTNDINVFIDMPLNLVADFCAGFPPDDFYVDEHAVTEAIRAKHFFNVIHPATGLKIDFIVLSESPFDRLRYARRKLMPVFPGVAVSFASPEDVILKKLVYFKEGGSEKHLRDIGGILRVQGNALDRAYIEQWAQTLSVLPEWRAVAEQESPS